MTLLMLGIDSLNLTQSTYTSEIEVGDTPNTMQLHELECELLIFYLSLWNDLHVPARYHS